MSVKTPQDAFLVLQREISPKDRTRLSAVTVDDLLACTKALEASGKTNATNELSIRLQPVISFLRRFAPAVDVAAQFDVNPSALIWGCLRALLEVAASFSHYFPSLIVMLERIGDKLGIYRRYEEICGESEEFKTALQNTYCQIHTFLWKAVKIFERRGIHLFIKSAWKPFELEYGNILHDLNRSQNILEEEINLWFRQNTEIERRRNIMDWLCPTDAQHYLEQHKACKTPRTAKWITADPTFEAWKYGHNSKSCLWISGSPGAGKTVLCTSIIENIQETLDSDSSGLTYYFFHKDQPGEGTLLSVTASLLSQIIGSRKVLPQGLTTRYNNAIKYGRAQISMADTPLELLRELASDATRLYIVLDALDESAEMDIIIKQMQTLSQSHPYIRVLFISRDLPNIRKVLNNVPKIKLTESLNCIDINTYLDAELAKMDEFWDDNASLKKTIFTRLSKGAGGIFLWTHLMIENIKSAESPEHLIAMTEDLPQGLSGFYASMLKEWTKLPSGTRDLTRRLFIWICCSLRPLTWQELSCALSYQVADGELKTFSKPFKKAVIQRCSPMIEFHENDDTFHPVHASVCDFILDSKWTIDQPDSHNIEQFLTPRLDAHLYIAQVSLRYLSLPEFETLVAADSGGALADYATCHWCSHLLSACRSEALEQTLKVYMSSGSRRRAWIARWLNSQMTAWPLQRVISQLRKVNGWIKESDTKAATFDELDDVFGALIDLDDFQNEHREKISIMPNVGHFERMMVIRDLVRVYNLGNRLTDAEDWLFRALEDKHKLYGLDALKGIWLLNSLGLIYDQQLEFGRAAEIQEKALALQEEQLPAQHLDTVWTVNELGRVYRHLHRLEESEMMHLRALAILEPLFPPEDARIVWTKNTLARSYRFQGRFSTALRFHLEAFESQKNAFGQDHAHTLWTMADVARCYRDMGNLEEALQWQTRTLEGRERVLSRKHADTAWSMNDVGLLLEALDRTTEARKYHLDALEIQNNVLGEVHPQTLWTSQHIKELNDNEIMMKSIARL